MKLKTLGICGGNGVILHPLRNNLLGNIEIRPIFNTPDQIQWKLNFHHAPCDITTSARYSKDLVDVIVGAPDCGHSSVFSYSRAKELRNPKDNESLTFFIKSVRHYKPKVFMMENLPKLLENYEEGLQEGFDNYHIVRFVGSVSNFGNSQETRLRLVMVGIRKDLDILKISSCFKLDEKALTKVTDERALLLGLGKIEQEELCHVREPDDYMVHMFYDGEKKISVKKARELWNGEYKELKKWPVNHGNLINQPGVYRNFGEDSPLTVRKQNRQFNHNGYMLSPREMARIQGIPDSFKLWLDPSKKLYCINKARATVAKTPPYEIGKWFKDCLEIAEKYL